MDVEALERECLDGSKKMDQLQEAVHEIHERLAEQEERLNTLRTKLETKEDAWRLLVDRVERADWEGRFKEIQTQFHDLDKHKVGHAEKLDLFASQIQSHEEAQEALLEKVVKLQERSFLTLQTAASAGLQLEGTPDTSASTPGGAAAGGLVEAFSASEGGADAGGGGPAGEALVQVNGCLLRVEELEARFDEVAEEVRLMRSDADLGPRVGELVECLRQVAPKVMEHENCFRDLHEKVGSLEATHRMQRSGSEAGCSPGAEGVLARLNYLEGEIARLLRDQSVSGSMLSPSKGEVTWVNFDEASHTEETQGASS
jgi:DNA repair exonuclease SbcCD ATPase subunit